VPLRRLTLYFVLFAALGPAVFAPVGATAGSSLDGPAAPNGFEMNKTTRSPLPTVLPPPQTSLPIRWSSELWSPARAGTFLSGQAVLGLASAADGAAIGHGYGLRIVESGPTLRTILVEGSQQALRSVDDGLVLDSRLRYVEPVHRLELQHRRLDPLTYQVDPATGRPYEWNFGAVHLGRALNISRGDPNILVGIVDSGFAQVPDLTNKYAKGWYCTNQATTACEDAVGHGTFVASIVASNNDHGVGLAGFCGACRLDVYRETQLSTFDTAAAIRRLTDDGVRVPARHTRSPGGRQFASSPPRAEARSKGLRGP